LELNQIAAFLAVVQMNSISGAATLLHLSQPAVSRRIQLLEQELDTKLFDRTQGGVAMTHAGETFLPYAQRISGAVQDAKAAVADSQAQAAREVRMAMVGTLASTEFTQVLLAFRQLHPDIQLHLHTALSHQVSNFVRDGTVDLGLRYFTDTNAVFRAELIGSEPLVVVVSANRFSGKETGFSIADIYSMPWVCFPVEKGGSGEPFARLVERQLSTNGLAGEERILIDSLTAQKRLIEADFGVGLLPRSSVEEELRLGTLRRLDIADLETTVPIYLLYRREGHRNRAHQSLIDHLVSHSSL